MKELVLPKLRTPLVKMSASHLNKKKRNRAITDLRCLLKTSGSSSLVKTQIVAKVSRSQKTSKTSRTSSVSSQTCVTGPVFFRSIFITLF